MNVMTTTMMFRGSIVIVNDVEVERICFGTDIIIIIIIIIIVVIVGDDILLWLLQSYRPLRGCGRPLPFTTSIRSERSFFPHKFVWFHMVDMREMLNGFFSGVEGWDRDVCVCGCVFRDRPTCFVWRRTDWPMRHKQSRRN